LYRAGNAVADWLQLGDGGWVEIAALQSLNRIEEFRKIIASAV
jgi:hypothetical protein